MGPGWPGGQPGPPHEVSAPWSSPPLLLPQLYSLGWTRRTRGVWPGVIQDSNSPDQVQVETVTMDSESAQGCFLLS